MLLKFSSVYNIMKNQMGQQRIQIYGCVMQISSGRKGEEAMAAVLLRAFSFFLIILVGILLRKSGFLPEQAGDTAKKLVIYVTLPCAIILNFSRTQEVSPLMLLITLMGLLSNIFMLTAGVLLTRRRDRRDRVLYMFCMPALNIGAFCLPFVQSFLPAEGTVTACMFDVGNSLMCTGGTYAFVDSFFSDRGKGFDIRGFFRRLLSSPPILAYVGMFLLMILKLRLPEAVLTLIEPAAVSNTFLAMLMIGLLFHLELKKEYLKDILRIVAYRQIFGVLLASVSYFALPFDLVIRQTLVLIAFAPISAVGPAFTGMCGGDAGKASAANSITILLSILEVTVLLLLLGLG